MLAFLVVRFLPAENHRVAAVIAVSTGENLKGPRHVDAINDLGSCRDPCPLPVDIKRENDEVSCPSCSAAFIEYPVDYRKVLVG